MFHLKSVVNVALFVFLVNYYGRNLLYFFDFLCFISLDMFLIALFVLLVSNFLFCLIPLDFLKNQFRLFGV